MSQNEASCYEYRIVLGLADGTFQRLSPQGTDLNGAVERLQAILDEADEGVYWNGWVERRPLDRWETFRIAQTRGTR